MPSPGALLANRYRISRELGAGGMGTVYLAEHVHLGRPTAVKVLRSELTTDPNAEARFRREAMLAARINHPAIAQVYDFDCTESGEFLLAMEFVEGETVAQRMRRAGLFTLPHVAQVVSQVGEGLDHAHRYGILHRDLKPENIMLGAGGVVKLLDFGVARPMESSGGITTGGYVLGTPAYMSPEQLVGDALTPATDIYSLGVVVYEMLTGQLPHPSATLAELRTHRMMRPASPVSLLRTEVPRDLSNAVARALEVEPGARWPSAAAFAREVVSALAHPLRAPAPVMSFGGLELDSARRLDRWEAHFEALRFAGRDREIRAVRDTWAAARAGRAMVLWVEGDEGAGKSAFFELARREAASDGAAQLVGRGYEVDVARPFGPWIGMLRTALDLWAARGRRWPTIGALTDANVETQVGDRAVLFDEISYLVREAAKRGPLFVGLEDLEWCDPGSQSLLEFVACDLSNVPLLTVVTLTAGSERPGAPRAREIRERLTRMGNVTRVRVNPLGYDAVAHWLAGALGREAPPPLVDFVYGHTEGNAFFIEQVVRSLVERGQLENLSDEQVRVTLANAPPPDGVTGVIRRRLERLSPSASEVLQIAAVIGREFETELVLTLSQQEEDAVLKALDEAVAAGVLTLTDPMRGDHYRFTHVKIAHVHAQGMHPRRRRRLHAEIARLMSDRADAPGLAAWHWYHAGEPARASEFARRAARRALAVHDYDDALTLGVLASEVAQTEDERREAHELRGDALRRLDRHAEASAAYARARLAGGAEDAQRVLRCKELRSALVVGAVAPRAAAEEAAQLARQLAELPAERRVAAEVVLAEALVAAGQLEAASAAARRAHHFATEAEDRHMMGDALLVLGTALERLGDLTAARAAAEQASALFGEIGNRAGAARASMLRSAITTTEGDRAAARAT